MVRIGTPVVNGAVCVGKCNDKVEDYGTNGTEES